MIGGQAAVRSAPDGLHAFYRSGGTIAAVPALRKNPPYDPVADITPISLLGKIAVFLFVHPSVPAKTLSELIDYARANPGKLNYGNWQSLRCRRYLPNSMSIASWTWFMSLTRVRPAMTELRYRGGLQLMFANATNAVPQVKEGKLRALVTLLERGVAPANVPTAAEQEFRACRSRVGSPCLGRQGVQGGHRPPFARYNIAHACSGTPKLREHASTKQAFEPKVDALGELDRIM